VALNDYLNGFSSQGHTIQAIAHRSVIRIVPSLSTPVGFVSAAFASAAETASSPAGICANSIAVFRSLLLPASRLASQGGAVNFLH
jgi:hypothetical protein